MPLQRATRRNDRLPGGTPTPDPGPHVIQIQGTIPITVYMSHVLWHSSGFVLYYGCLWPPWSSPIYNFFFKCLMSCPQYSGKNKDLRQPSSKEIWRKGHSSIIQRNFQNNLPEWRCSLIKYSSYLCTGMFFLPNLITNASLTPTPYSTAEINSHSKNS